LGASSRPTEIIPTGYHRNLVGCCRRRRRCCCCCLLLLLLCAPCMTPGMMQRMHSALAGARTKVSSRHDCDEVGAEKVTSQVAPGVLSAAGHTQVASQWTSDHVDAGARAAACRGRSASEADRKVIAFTPYPRSCFSKGL